MKYNCILYKLERSISIKNQVEVKFIGGNAENVTGSKILVKYNKTNILLDYGSQQGRGGTKDYLLNRSLNNQIAPSTIDYVILSHAHADHSCLMPTLYKYNFKGKFIVPMGTCGILEYLMKDSMFLSGNTAEHLNKLENTDKYEPYYNRSDIIKTIDNSIELDYYKSLQLSDDIRVEFINAGHINHSAMVILYFKDNEYEKKLVYTGDLGSLLFDYKFTDKRDLIPNADIVIAESTYARKPLEIYSHKKELDELENVIISTLKNEGKVLIPAFSLHRTEEVANLVYDICKKNHIKKSIYLDSPLSINIFNIYKKEFSKLQEIDRNKSFKKISTSKASQSICKSDESCVIIASSGMLVEGTRASYHLASIIDDKRNTIIKMGYCAENTLGGKLIDDKPMLTIMGIDYRKSLNIVEFHTFSSHIQHDEMVDVYSDVKAKGLYLVHGNALDKLVLKKDVEDKQFQKCTTTKIISVKHNNKVVF